MKKILFWIAAAAMLVAACEENLEPLEKPAPPDEKPVVTPVEEAQKGVWMTVPPILFDDPTKVSMSVDESTGLSFLWSEGDKAGVYPDEVTGLSLYTLTAGTGTSSATFDGGGFSLTDGKKYYAFYPYDGNATSKTALPLSFAGQVATADNDIVSPMARDYLWAEAVSDAGNASFKFAHIGSFVRLRLAGLTAGQQISKVQLIPMYGNLTDAGTFDITSHTLTETAATPSRDITTTVTVPDGGTSTIWAMMAPQDFSADHFAVAATIDGNLYSARLAGKNQQAGKAYRWNVTPLAASSAPTLDFSATELSQVQMTSVESGEYSGITYLGPNGEGIYRFAVVDDHLNGGGIVFFDIPIAADGTVTGSGVIATVPEGTSGSSVSGKDNEDIVFDGTSLWVSSEKDQSIRKYNLADGSSASDAFTIPADMASGCLSSSNAGFEALTYNATTGKFWTTTELPLSKDNFLPRLHRLQRFSSDHQPDARYLYQMDEPTVSSSDATSAKAYVFGIPAMTALDDGRLIVLEREIFVPPFSGPEDIATVQANSFAKVKLYVVDPEQDGAGILRKALLAEFQTGIESYTIIPPSVQASFANYEGMCLGPELGGKQSLILIADSQGGMKTTYKTSYGSFTLTLTREFVKVILF